MAQNSRQSRRNRQVFFGIVWRKSRAEQDWACPLCVVQHVSEVKSAVEVACSASQIAPAAPAQALDSPAPNSQPLNSPAPTSQTVNSVRLYKLLDVKETHYRTTHHATFLAASGLLCVATTLFVVKVH